MFFINLQLLLQNNRKYFHPLTRSVYRLDKQIYPNLQHNPLSASIALL